LRSLQCLLNGFDRLINIQHLAMLNTVAVGTAKPENLQFAILIFTAAIAAIFVVPMSSPTISAYLYRRNRLHCIPFVLWFIDCVLVVCCYRKSFHFVQMFFIFCLRAFVLRGITVVSLPCAAYHYSTN
jgi:hypothetical protein